MIDERAIIHPNAKIAANVSVGPFSIIGENVEIDSGTHIGAHVVIKGPTKIGKNNQIFQFASVGEAPQDKKYANEQTELHIGDHNVIREFVTMNRGTSQDKGITKIGSHNLFMNYVHIAHDCFLGDHIILANSVSLAGHVHLDDYVIVGGHAGVRQFCHIGAHAFVTMGTFVAKDIPPFILVSGHDAAAVSINMEGLKRRNFSPEEMLRLRRAYKTIYRQGLTVEEAISQLQTEQGDCVHTQALITFLQQSSRGITR